MKDLLIYSTIAGEIPLLVHKNIPKCFVEYDQYLELKKQLDNYQKVFDKARYILCSSQFDELDELLSSGVDAAN